MPKPGDHLLVHFIAPQPIGLRFERTRHDWPLHITLTPWFTAPALGRLSMHMHEVSANIAPIPLIVGPDEMFGPDRDIAVNPIANPEPVANLQRALLDILAANQGHLESNIYTNDGFRPHITQHNGDRNYEGDIVGLNDFHLVAFNDPNICEIIERFALGGEKA